LFLLAPERKCCSDDDDDEGNTKNVYTYFRHHTYTLMNNKYQNLDFTCFETNMAELKPVVGKNVSVECLGFHDPPRQVVRYKTNQDRRT